MAAISAGMTQARGGVEENQMTANSSDVMRLAYRRGVIVINGDIMALGEGMYMVAAGSTAETARNGVSRHRNGAVACGAYQSSSVISRSVAWRQHQQRNQHGLWRRYQQKRRSGVENGGRRHQRNRESVMKAISVKAASASAKYGVAAKTLIISMAKRSMAAYQCHGISSSVSIGKATTTAKQIRRRGGNIEVEAWYGGEQNDEAAKNGEGKMAAARSGVGGVIVTSNNALKYRKMFETKARRYRSATSHTTSHFYYRLTCTLLPAHLATRTSW